MKIIFLDMDGPLCTIRSHIGQGGRGIMRHLDREAVGLLNVLAEVPPEPVRFVLSSTWRMMYSRAEMEEILRKYDWRGKFHEDWRTKLPKETTGAPLIAQNRGGEVAEWLSRHPEVTTWIALDDDSDFLEEQMPRLVLCHTYDGMSWQNFQTACALLHGNAHAWHDRRKEREAREVSP